jgi:hypothetical protein
MELLAYAKRSLGCGSRVAKPAHIDIKCKDQESFLPITLTNKKPGSHETKFQLSFSIPLDISLLTFWIYAILSKAQILNNHLDKPKLHRNPMKG